MGASASVEITSLSPEALAKVRVATDYFVCAKCLWFQSKNSRCVYSETVTHVHTAF